MVNPQYLITHHGADARLLTLAEMKRIYQDTHFINLYKKYDQPRSTNKSYPDIAYHLLVGSDGWSMMRDFDIEGYHASNYPVNINSIAICISGNYDTMKLTPAMERHYREAVRFIREQLPSLKYYAGHRAYSSKSCPGKNISDAFIKEVFETAGKPQDTSAAKQHIRNAIAELELAFNNL